MLFNEPKLLKCGSFSRLLTTCCPPFSALQRAEIAEISVPVTRTRAITPFSALQRAEIAEMRAAGAFVIYDLNLSVLFNEPKLLK